MEMTHYVNSSIELKIGAYGIHSEMCNEHKCIDSMVECCYANYVSDIMIICECQNKPLYGLLVSVWKWTIM